MGIFDWLKRDPESKGMVRRRAVVIPHLPNVETMSNSIENTSSADGVSTLGLTVRLLEPGESASAIGAQYPRLPVIGVVPTSPLPEGCQRVHVNAPNWVHLMVRQEWYVYREHAEIPVWFDPKRNRIWRVDKDRLIEELLPEKPHAKALYDEYGLTGLPKEANETPGHVMNATQSMEGFIETTLSGASKIIAETGLSDLNPFDKKRED